MVPEFLISDWNNPMFPTSHSQYVIETEEVNDLTPCLKPWSFAQWAKEWRTTDLDLRPTWVVPPEVFLDAPLPLVRQAGFRNADPLFRQLVVSNADNHQLRNDFLGPLREDLNLHSKTIIPLIPTGEALDLDAKYMAEMVFEPKCQYFAFTLMDNNEGRKVRLEVTIFDHSIQVAIMVNGRKINHGDNDYQFAVGDARNGYWDMDG